MWGLFNSEPPPPSVPVYVIVDKATGEQFNIDDDYRILGLSEGWLTLSGYHTVGGVFYLEYEHTA